MTAVRLSLLAMLAALAACGPSKPDPAKPDPISDPARARAKIWAVRAAESAAADEAARNAMFEAAPDCRPSFKFTPADQLSLAEQAMLQGERTSPPLPAADAAHSYRLAYRSFDYEGYPTRRDWFGMGVVYVRADPPDRRTIGGVLWSRNPNFLPSGGDEFSSQADGESLIVSMIPDYANDEGTKITCIPRFRVKLTKDGVLIAGGKRVGVFR